MHAPTAVVAPAAQADPVVDLLSAWKGLFTCLPHKPSPTYSYLFVEGATSTNRVVQEATGANRVIQEAASRIISSLVREAHDHASAEGTWIAVVRKCLPAHKFTWQETLYVIGEIIVPALGAVCQ
jgi:hypothetical protein